jgi:phosphocarrier protein HPr
MRPAMMFARIAGRYRSTVTIRKQDRAANGKSMTHLMLLAASQGTELELEVSGDDAEQAFPVLSEALAAQSSDDLEPLLK